MIKITSLSTICKGSGVNRPIELDGQFSIKSQGRAMSPKDQSPCKFQYIKRTVDKISVQQQLMANKKQHTSFNTSLMPKPFKSPLEIRTVIREKERRIIFNLTIHPKIDRF